MVNNLIKKCESFVCVNDDFKGKADANVTIRTEEVIDTARPIIA